MCDRLKEQRDRAESEHQEECDLYTKRNHDLKTEVDRLHLDVTDRQVSQYRQVDRLHSDVTYRQVKGRSNSNSRTWLYIFYSTIGCVWGNGHVEITRSQVMFYVSKQKDFIKFLFPDVILYEC